MRKAVSKILFLVGMYMAMAGFGMNLADILRPYADMTPYPANIITGEIRVINTNYAMLFLGTALIGLFLVVVAELVRRDDYNKGAFTKSVMFVLLVVFIGQVAFTSWEAVQTLESATAAHAVKNKIDETQPILDELSKIQEESNESLSEEDRVAAEQISSLMSGISDLINYHEVHNRELLIRKIINGNASVLSVLCIIIILYVADRRDAHKKARWHKDKIDAIFSDAMSTADSDEKEAGAEESVEILEQPEESNNEEKESDSDEDK